MCIRRSLLSKVVACPMWLSVTLLDVVGQRTYLLGCFEVRLLISDQLPSQQQQHCDQPRPTDLTAVTEIYTVHVLFFILFRSVSNDHLISWVCVHVSGESCCTCTHILLQLVETDANDYFLASTGLHDHTDDSPQRGWNNR